jgi:hypothetical protein
LGRCCARSILRDDDPVGHEVVAARERALRAGLERLDGDRSPVADAVRQEFIAHLGSVEADLEEGEARRFAHRDIHISAVQAAREVVLGMRANEEIGDDAFPSAGGRARLDRNGQRLERGQRA